jgi:hypothetical protein
MIPRDLQALLRAYNRLDEVDVEEKEKQGIEIGTESKYSAPMILMLSGFIVRGTAITIREYHSLVHQKATDDLAKQTVESLYALPVELPPDPPEDQKFKPEDEWPEYLYLRDVQISGDLEVKLPFFAILLDSIDGWTLGSVT